ncbi:MAG: VWA domain-containing protein [Gemmatimonadetes bacterium]|nr:VWA domain-containing protein [Gemmatimonadota bacterium]
MSDRDLVRHLARFCGALRDLGVAVRLSDEVDGAQALGLVDVGDRTEVGRALGVALKIKPTDRPAFAALFDAWWREAPAELPDVDRRKDRPSVQGRTVRHAAPARSPFRETGDEGEDFTPGSGQEIGYSPEPLLRRKPFDHWTDTDLVEMDRVIARLALRLATRRSRRLVPTRGRGLIDLRRSLRHTIGTRGEVLTFARRARPIERPRVALLCDTSGSMDPHTKFLLTFVLSLGKVIRRADVFVFNTALTRVTPWLSRRAVHRTLERLATAAPDWSGGTRIGACLAEFVDRYVPGVVDHTTTVVILSDGLDSGDPAVLARAMRAIQSAARQVIWLNPLLGDSRYEPTARGMEAALPFVDHFAAAHTLESLERIVRLLAA